MTPVAVTRTIRILLAALVIYLGAVLLYQLSLLADGDYVNFSARILFKYHSITDPDALGGDYLTSYATAFKQPYLYEWITRAWLAVGGDLLFLHRLVALVCWLSFLAGMFLMVRPFGDRITVIGALAFVIAQPRYLMQITSAVPHAFAFPLMAWAMVALLRGSAGGLALVTLASGLIYPALAPLTGLLLAWQLLIARPFWRESGSRRAMTGALLVVTAVVSLWLVVGAITPLPDFGASLAPGEKVEIYPENSQEGVFGVNLSNPLRYVAAGVAGQFNPVLGKYRAVLFAIYFFFGIYGIFALPRGSAARNAVIVLIACVAAVCLVILALKPHYLYRFFFYSGYTILPPLFVVGLRHFCRKVGRFRPASEVASVAALLLLVLTVDSFNATKTGYRWRLDAEHRQVMSFAAAQPPGSLFAAFPGGENHFEWIPYLVRRPLLVMMYLHEPRYEKHILEMRARMDALIEAYFASEPAPLRRLHCAWGVDFMIVDKAHFAADAEPPWYFSPFDARIEAIWHKTPREEFLLRNPDPAQVALELDSFYVLRLAEPCNTN